MWLPPVTPVSLVAQSVQNRSPCGAGAIHYWAGFYQTGSRLSQKFEIFQILQLQA